MEKIEMLIPLLARVVKGDRRVYSLSREQGTLGPYFRLRRLIEKRSLCVRTIPDFYKLRMQPLLVLGRTGFSDAEAAAGPWFRDYLSSVASISYLGGEEGFVALYTVPQDYVDEYSKSFTDLGLEVAQVGNPVHWIPDQGLVTVGELDKVEYLVKTPLLTTPLFMPPAKFDETDLKILSVLQEDGLAKPRYVSRMTGLPLSRVRYRLLSRIPHLIAGNKVYLSLYDNPALMFLRMGFGNMHAANMSLQALRRIYNFQSSLAVVGAPVIYSTVVLGSVDDLVNLNRVFGIMRENGMGVRVEILGFLTGGLRAFYRINPGLFKEGRWINTLEERPSVKALEITDFLMVPAP